MNLFSSEHTHGPYTIRLYEQANGAIILQIFTEDYTKICQRSYPSLAVANAFLQHFRKAHPLPPV